LSFYYLLVFALNCYANVAQKIGWSSLM